jgi:hypothetical protein
MSGPSGSSTVLRKLEGVNLLCEMRDSIGEGVNR